MGTPALPEWMPARAEEKRSNRRAIFLTFAAFIFLSLLLNVSVDRTKSGIAALIASPTSARQVVDPTVARFLADAEGPYIHATPIAALDPYAEHPIHRLMREAEEKWNAKVARQSTTLAEAEEEYRRRYKMEPPPGFNRWYDYCREHNVDLVDEYDAIMDDILPYLGLPGKAIRQRTQELGRREPSHFLFRVKNGAVLPLEGADWRSTVRDGWQELVTELLDYMPGADFEVAITMQDGPSTFLSMQAREAYEASARSGVATNETGLMSDEIMLSSRERHCPMDSKIRKHRAGFDLQSSPGGPAFVGNDHRAAMSYCNDPEVRPLNGATAADGWVNELIMPSWSMASLRKINGDVSYPARILYDLNPEDERPFLEKSQHKVVWRGSPDGIEFSPSQEWRRSHRYRLIKLTGSDDEGDMRLVRQTRVDVAGREYQVDVPISLAELNKRYSNIEATKGVEQGEPRLGEAINAVFKVGERISKEEMASHRFVFDVDGNTYSARFRAHLQSYQVPLKATIWTEWYSDRIQPWLHYVPVRQDYSDLYHIMSFFDGGIDEARTGHHDALAEKIANAGREWANTHWRHEDMQAYFLRALLEWNRVVDPARTMRAP